MKHFITISEILLRGDDVLKANSTFKLVGRDEELADISSVLMKMRKRNLIITGRGGVGISAIVLGIQASKQELSTPVDIVGKRFFWLNTDKLFESGNNQSINAQFERIRETLAKSRNSVLVIEDTVDFLNAAQNHGCTNLLNGLMGDLKGHRYQGILETQDELLGEILKCDGDILETCTLYEVHEPSAENLRLITKESQRYLEEHHGIAVGADALEAAVALTEKYKLTELRAQPDAALTLLDQALTDYAREFHRRRSLAADPTWELAQREIRALYKDIRLAEEEIRRIEDEIERLRVSQVQNAGSIEQSSDTRAFTQMMASSHADTPEVTSLRERIKKITALLKESNTQYRDKTAHIYAGVSIDASGVMKSFSALSGIPVDKLNEDERVRLKGLQHLLASRVVGQPEPTEEVAKAVKRSRLGLKMPNKPSGTFMFLGPSGVGKTELAKTLAEALQVPLLRFDMSEYMEKHAVAKLIGAPPGYEGYEQGGILTNAARRNPYSVVLFDEIEKAHVDVFNLMLQLLDDARLTDSRGLTASFKDTVVIMTTNIGTQHFLDEAVSFDEAKERAVVELRAQYKPEFLGRFGGNIYCFQRLGMEVLMRIAKKDLLRINAMIKDRGLSLSISESDLLALITSKYVPREGARSILGYIDRHITSGIADVVLGDTPAKGPIVAVFDKATDSVVFKHE